MRQLYKRLKRNGLEIWFCPAVNLRYDTEIEAAPSSCAVSDFQLIRVLYQIGIGIVTDRSCTGRFFEAESVRGCRLGASETSFRPTQLMGERKLLKGCLPFRSSAAVEKGSCICRHFVEYFTHFPIVPTST